MFMDKIEKLNKFINSSIKDQENQSQNFDGYSVQYIQSGQNSATGSGEGANSDYDLLEEA